MSTAPGAIAAAVVLFAAVAGLRFVSDNAALGIGFLYVAPVVVLGARFRTPGVISGVIISLLLTLGWDLARDIQLGPIGYVVRGAVLAFGGGAAALFSVIGTRLQQESHAWFEQAIDMNCVATPDGTFLRVNEAFVRTLGYSREELLSKPFIDFVHPDDRDRTISETIKLAERLGDTVGFENRYLAADETYRWLRWSATTVEDGSIYASARDVTQQKELELQLEQLATTDALTGLLNRRHFEELSTRALDHVRRYGETAAVLMIDLDGFKAVNDRIGHHAGDEVLRRVSDGLRSRLRASDLVGRFGGDEFAVFLPETAAGGARAVASTLLERIESCSWRRGDDDIRIAGTIGIAVLDPKSDAGIDELLRRADQALLEAKRGGGGRFVLHDESAREARS